MNVEELAGRVVRGDPRAIARAISLVEGERPARETLMGLLHRSAGHALVIGVTGPPGAGKSTLVDRLVTHRRSAGSSVGVIAVDPSSPFTGGAILGDRVRMTGHAADDQVFVRSMASRGRLGGIAGATAEAVAILDAAGKDVVIVETVGVGQDEVEIVSVADVSVVVLVPGAGDDVQAIKAGIMEIADVFVVNKADREGADRVVQTIAAALALRAAAPGERRPEIVKTEATRGVGVGELWAAVERRQQRPAAERVERQRARQRARLLDLVMRRFKQRLEETLAPGEIERTVDQILEHGTDPYTAATGILHRVCR